MDSSLDTSGRSVLLSIFSTTGSGTDGEQSGSKSKQTRLTLTTSADRPGPVVDIRQSVELSHVELSTSRTFTLVRTVVVSGQRTAATRTTCRLDKSNGTRPLIKWVIYYALCLGPKTIPFSWRIPSSARQEGPNLVVVEAIAH